MSLSLYEKIWFVAGIAFIAYPIGDLLGYWDIEALIVLLWSGVLILTGWNVGKRKGVGNG